MPKSGQSSGKPRKKSEKDRIKKEEVEAAQAEEIRQNLEKEVKEREENEKALIDERIRLEEEERSHRSDLIDQLKILWETGYRDHLEKGVQERIDDKWSRYMLCDGSPDPTILGEIHTFITLMYEDLNRSFIPEVLDDSKLILKLINELNNIIESTPIHELMQKYKTQHLETIEELQGLLMYKLDIGCQQLLLKASYNADGETANLQKIFLDEANGSQISICIWANLSKNPRIKSHTFDEINLTFEITKSLMLTDCAIRFQRMKYDHYSPRTASYYPRRKVDVIEKVITELTNDGVESSKNFSVKDGSVKDGSVKESNKDKEELKIAESTKTESVFSTSVNGETQISQQIESDEVPEETEKLDFEDFVGDLDSIDMRCNHVLGGVFYFNLLQLPPQAKAVNRWVMTQVTEPLKLIYIDYQEQIGTSDDSYLGSTRGSVTGSARPSLLPVDIDDERKQRDEADETDDSSVSDTHEQDKKNADQKVNEGNHSGKQNTLGAATSETKTAEKSSIAIRMKLPAEVYFCEEPQVVRWNESLKEWRTEGFTDIKFDEEQRMLSLSTNDFGIMALIQDAHMNMPFQSWELRPRGQNHVTFTIIAAIVECEFEIKDTLCRLVQPDRPELKHLLKTWLKPQHFIKQMRQSGLNIFPDIDSSKYVSTQFKSYALEQDVYRQMALTASSVAYCWSKWNAQTNTVMENSTRRSSIQGMSLDKFIIFQSAEHLKDEHLLEEQWFIHLVTKKRTIRLKMNEFAEKFSDDHASGTEYYPTLYHLNKSLASPQGLQRIDRSSQDFVHTLHTILCSVRPLIYS